MGLKIGIDVGGTFTDFLVAWENRDPEISKVLSTPIDPSIAVIDGLSEIAASLDTPVSVEDFAGSIETIVHGTTVTTNATLTRRGAKAGLLTTNGMRDALEMRRGIREEQYNNRYTNVEPLVPRYLRQGINGRLDRNGSETQPLSIADIEKAIEVFKEENVEAVAICFMNSFANPEHEKLAADLVRKLLPNAYLTVSSNLLPSIRFYERVSTTALNTYIGPILSNYLDQLIDKLANIGFGGILLIMQSNGGVMSPEVARESAALTLLSGPAAGPGAGQSYARVHDQENCIVIDMGGTSFEAALVVGNPVVVNEGTIDRHRISLPMLGIHTIGAGGGSIGWLDEGGLLRMGPQSAGADPGPASYRKGGTLPTCTDANLVLGYLNPAFFAGGKMELDMDAARSAIDKHIAKPLGMTIEEAAAGMYRVSCNNMAQGVREITIKRGYDPREFPMVVAGGAGPLHSCQICEELEIPFQIVPRESSILCAVGMLMADMQHDFVWTFVSLLDDIDWPEMDALTSDMISDGRKLLEDEQITADQQEYRIKFDCRYVKQYHEVSFVVPQPAIEKRDVDSIADIFHAEHNRLYGYSLKEQVAPIEIINVRVQALGITEKPTFRQENYVGKDPSSALKGERSAYIPTDREFTIVPVYDGHKMHYGNLVPGPAIIEQITTAIFVSECFDCLVDQMGSFVLFEKGREDLVSNALEGNQS